MANEGRISSFDGAVVTYPELRVVGNISTPPFAGHLINIPLEAGPRDAEEIIPTGAMAIAGPTIQVGNWAGNRWALGLSFRVYVDLFNVIINEAKIRVYIIGTGGAPLIRIYAEVIANSPAFVAVNCDITRRELTTGFASWYPVGAAVWQEIDVTSVLQDFIGQVGASWVVDNYVTFVFKDGDNAPGNNVIIQAYDVGGMVSDLDIAYSEEA